MKDIKSFLLGVWEKDGIWPFLLAMAAIVAAVMLLATLFGEDIIKVILE